MLICSSHLISFSFPFLYAHLNPSSLHHQRARAWALARLYLLKHGHHLNHRGPLPSPIVQTRARHFQMPQQLHLQTQILPHQLRVKNVTYPTPRALLNPPHQIIILPELSRVSRLPPGQQLEQNNPITVNIPFRRAPKALIILGRHITGRPG
ncbi:hypothetical protein STAS_11386 [Striga asiatica]|uniref:Uncharacterized protein n=1 Tax=Striga asiatica TaxID=4170 RepID=A0A5A7PQP0_STRAF|nr:hypothetical protein STAS_11386 [Striga asiatica]